MRLYRIQRVVTWAKRLLWQLVLVIYGLAIAEPVKSVPSLELGDRRREVAYLQNDLAKQGIYQGRIDGIYGEETEEAVRTFQQANNLVADGVAGEQTQSVIQARLGIAAPQGNLGLVQTFTEFLPNSAIGNLILGTVVVSTVVMILEKSGERPDPPVDSPENASGRRVYTFQYTVGDFKYEGEFDANTELKREIIDDSGIVVKSDKFLLNKDFSFKGPSISSGKYKLIVAGQRNGSSVIDEEYFEI